MNTTLAILLLLTALVGFVYAVTTHIRVTGKANIDRERASTTFDRTWAIASVLATVGTTGLLEIDWLWVGLVWGGWLLAGWYCKWFGVGLLGAKLLHRPVGLWNWSGATYLRSSEPSDIVVRKELIGSIVWTFISAALVLLVVVELDHEVRLLQEGVKAEAIVTNHRTSQANNGDIYEVQYQFSQDNGGLWYSGGDATGRTNLWESLTKPDYETAMAMGKVDILFWPQNPWVNRPLRCTPSVPDTGTLVVIGLVALTSTAVAFNKSREYVGQ